MQKPPLHSHLAIAIQAIDAFASNGKLDAEELQKMLDTALADGEINADERRVLAKVIGHATGSGLDADTIALIAQIKSRHGIG